MALHDAALNQLQISKQFEVSRCCVQSPIKKHQQLGRFDDLKYTGRRPEKLSSCEIRHLKGLLKGDSQLSKSKIATDLNISLPKLVKTRTMRRYLKDLGVKYVIKDF